MKQWITKSGYKIVRILSGRSNVFLLTNNQINILVDTSAARYRKKLFSSLASLNVNSIDYLILTHAHFDHAGNAPALKDKFRCKVIIQKNEAKYLSGGDNILPKGTTFFTRPLIKFGGKYAFGKFRYTPCEADIQVDSVYDLNELGFNARLLHTPGHTSGSMSLIVDDEIALVGDAMFGIFQNSVFPPFAEDEVQMVKSWGELLETNCILFLPSHGSANARALVEKDYNRRRTNYVNQLG